MARRAGLRRDLELRVIRRERLIKQVLVLRLFHRSRNAIRRSAIEREWIARVTWRSFAR